MIRPIQKADNKKMADIIRQVMTEFGASGEGFSIHDAEVDKMYESYMQKGAVYFIAEKDGAVVGGAGIGPLPGASDDFCELKKMYFLREARGIGLGQEIIEECLKTAKELGYKNCYIETVDHMQAANKLYRKNGFEKIKGPLGSTGHHGCELFYLKKL